MKALLITGGCGFMGSHFVRFCLKHRDWRIINLDNLTYAGSLDNLSDLRNRDRYTFVKGDIADRELLESLFAKEKLWAVANFAAESHVDRSILDCTPFLQTNVIGVQTLLDAARRHRVKRFVQISTDEVYGDAEGKNPCHENSPLVPSSPYAASKAGADLLCIAYRRTHGVPVLIVRSCNNYGPFQFPEKLIPLMIRNATSGAELPLYGDGLQRREWLYIEDTIEGILRVLEEGQVGTIYNLGAGDGRTNVETVRTLCRLLADEAGLDARALLARIRFITDRPGHDRRYALDTKRIQETLGWAPRVSFATGLRRTVRWYLDHMEWVQRATSEEYLTYSASVYERGWIRSSDGK